MSVPSEAVIATVVAVVVSLSLPFFVYGAWIILRVETVTWEVLVRHLTFIGIGLVLTTVPVVVWMVPRLFTRADGFLALHAFFGVQAYAFLAFGLTGIIRIFNAKRKYNLYHRPDQDIELDELGENMGIWRSRLRAGVFGFLGLWILAWIVGIVRYVIVYTKIV